MQAIELTAQGERTLLFCRSSDTEHAAQFVFDTLRRLQSSVVDGSAVPFLAFCNLSPETFSVGEQSYIEAGYVVQSSVCVPDGAAMETKPPARILTCTVKGEPESRSAMHLELLLYAKIYGMKLVNTVYEYYFLAPEKEGETEKITVFVATILD